MRTFSDTSLPLLFPDLSVRKKRLVYVKPFVKWIRDLTYAVSGVCFDLPLSDLEYKFAYPDVAFEQGRISEIEYKKIKKYFFN